MIIVLAKCPYMEKIIMPVSGRFSEVIISNTEISLKVSRACGAGKLRKLASRLYTWNQVDDPEELVKRNLWEIVVGYFPGALVADRTALESVPAGDGSVCLITTQGRDIQLPGHTLRPRRGVGPLPSDLPFMNGLWLCSTARAYLENMRYSRMRGRRVRRTLPAGQIKERLDTLARRAGREAVDRLRDEIRDQAGDLDMLGEAARLDAMIETLQGRKVGGSLKKR